MNIWTKAKQKVHNMFSNQPRDIEFVVANVEKSVDATNRNGDRVTYYLPTKDADLGALCRVFERYNIPAMVYKSSLFPNPVISIRFDDYFSELNGNKKTQDFIVNLHRAIQANQTPSTVMNAQRVR